MLHRLVLLLIAGVVVRTAACPFMCLCRELDDGGGGLVECGGDVATSFTNFTSLDNRTKELRLIGFAEGLQDIVTELQQGDFPIFSRLVVKRSLVDLYNLSGSVWGRLKSLELVDCKLDLLPDSIANLTQLQTLDVSNNELKVVELQPFRTLNQLEVLNLSGNSLEQLKADSFEGLNVLRCLDLSTNNLTVVGDGLLAPLVALRYLNLSNNFLEVLNEVSFSSLMKLQQLDVSWNRLAKVAPGSLELPSLARLLLAGNPRLGGSRDAAVLVGTGRRLQTVDASRTGLKQVPAALTHSIRTLRLAGNSIRFVNCGDLDSYPLLQLLDFTSNELELVEDDALGRLDSLTVLYLTDNHVRDIPRSLPEQLKVLHLEHNNIKKVSKEDLQGMASLEVLLLSDNKIRIVEEAAFSQLISLVTLDLSRNPVTILQPGCLSGPTALQVLRLASIGIVSQAAEVSFPLSTNEHLITLDLSGSPGLARQFLADTAAIAASRELQELDLSRTNLELIRPDLLHYLPQLRSLHLQSNNLNCSELQWLSTWMRRQDEPEYRTITCSSPPELWGTLLVDLQVIEILTTTSTVKPNLIRIKQTKKLDKFLLNNTMNEVIETSNNFFNLSTLKKLGKQEKIKVNHSTEQQQQHAINMQWNITSGEMSKFTTPSRPAGPTAMFILVAGVLAAAALLALLAATASRHNRRRHSRLFREQDEHIEVSSLPSVTELW